MERQFVIGKGSERTRLKSSLFERMTIHSNSTNTTVPRTTVSSLYTGCPRSSSKSTFVARRSAILILILQIVFVPISLVLASNSTNQSLKPPMPIAATTSATTAANQTPNLSASQPKNYTNHSVIKILEQNIHLLFDQQHHHNDDLAKNNTIGSEDDSNEHEVLWYDNSNRNASYAYVRLGPKISHRVKRDIRGMGNPRFVTYNLQSWLNAEHFRPYRHAYYSDIAGEIDDVGPLFPDTSMLASEVGIQEVRSKIVPSFVLNRYYPLSNVNRFIEDVERRTPGVTFFSIGNTHEGRPIKAVEIMNNPSDPRFIWIDACTHAREWVTVTTALYLIENIIVQKIPFNFIIVPVLNVDGYVYSWTKDRLWRKNRRPYEASRFGLYGMPDRCNGVDLNRNYNINFGGSGSSDNPCSTLYQGPHAFSEPEVAAASDLLKKNRHRIKMTLSLHSFNQLWACPNAFTKEKTPDYQHHMRVLRAVQQSVYDTNGVHYEAGPLGASLYLGSGFMMDWIYHSLKIRDAYLVELRDKGEHGFILPADQIWPTATETWEGLKTALRIIFQLNI